MKYGKSVDLWSIGVLTYFLLCGYTPFDAQNFEQEAINVMNGKFDFMPEEYWADISSEAKAFIRKMLQVDPNKRGTAREALQHPWIQKYASAEHTKIDLLPIVKERFNARRTFRKAVDVVKAINKLQAATSGNSPAPQRLHANQLDFSLSDLNAIRPIEESSEDGSIMVLQK